MPGPSLKWRTSPPPPPLPSPSRTLIATFGSYFVRECHDSLICFDARPVGEIAEYAPAHRQRFEDAGKPASKFTYTFWLWMNSDLSKHFFSSGRRLSSSNCSFIVYSNALRPRQLPSVDRSMPNRHAHVRIGPIVRRVRNTYKKRLSETFTSVLWDSAGYQNALLSIKSQPDDNNGLRDRFQTLRNKIQ